MTTVESATKLLDTMLGHLGFTVTIAVEQTHDGPCLQILSAESEAIIGKDGDRLDDFQYLVNRILRHHDLKAERIKVDCAHYRAIQEDQLNQEITGMAERVKATGKPIDVRPLNAYYRRLVHNILAADEKISSHSPSGEDRLKRITISLRQSPPSPPSPV